MKVKEYKYPSATGLCEINAWQWSPENGNIKAVIQIHHGMAEHCGRYKSVIEYLTGNGYAVFMNDMANHGKSNSSEADLGYFGENDGWLNIQKDAKTLFDIAKKEYPDKKMIISGHSMGSMVMRCFINQFGCDFDGAIFIGTSGKNNLAPISIGISNTVAALKGSKYKSQALYKLGFSSYDKPFEHRTSYDWGTSVKESVDDYMADPKCGFLFSAKGYIDLARLVMDCNADHWFENVDKSVPVLLLSGDMDPVGNYGKGVTEVYNRLKASGKTNVTLKLYPNKRHEILNEDNKLEVYNFIDQWIVSNVLNKQ